MDPDPDPGGPKTCYPDMQHCFAGAGADGPEQPGPERGNERARRRGGEDRCAGDPGGDQGQGGEAP